MSASDLARVRVGTAGWSLPRADQPRFAGDGAHLERYARVFAAAEINSSFYRPHRPELYAKWAASVPAGFRFSVKVPREITHDLRLLDCERPLADFLDQCAALGERLGCLLVQMPPSLEFDASLVGAFLVVLRALHDGPVVMEPRHPTWFSTEAASVLMEYDAGRVAADPAIVANASRPGAARGIAYFRLHGSPRIYWSRYEDAFLDALAERVTEARRRALEVWCIFDNTASGSAVPNALGLMERLEGDDAPHSPESTTTSPAG